MKLSPVTLTTLAAALLLSSAGLAAADTKVYPAAKTQIDLPAGWKVKDAANGITMAGAPADDAGLIVFTQASPTPATVKAAVDGLVAAMKITGVTWDEKLIEDKVHGLPLYARKGTGTADGKADDLRTVLVMNGTVGLVVISVVVHDHKDAYKAPLTATIESIQASK